MYIASHDLLSGSTWLRCLEKWVISPQLLGNYMSYFIIVSFPFLILDIHFTCLWFADFWKWWPWCGLEAKLQNSSERQGEL